MHLPVITREPKGSSETASCHTAVRADTTGLPLVAIVGSPNVGKSVLFNALTDVYVTVSNYPGTTQVARGRGRANDTEVGAVDAPGVCLCDLLVKRSAAHGRFGCANNLHQCFAGGCVRT
jgi:ribosome-interacting GTPase 1